LFCMPFAIDDIKNDPSWEGEGEDYENQNRLG
jgi:hypothetical protein